MAEWRYNTGTVQFGPIAGDDLHLLTNNLPRLTISREGPIGIGTTPPLPASGIRLDVAGDVRAFRFLTSSDLRLKKNVAPLTGVLERLEKVRGVTFEWNEWAEALGRQGGRREVGVIAQEIEAVFPEVVIPDGPEGYKAVDYSRLTAVLIEAVKELKAENEGLQGMLAELRQRIEALERR